MKAANEAKSADHATPVTFDTLKAAQELKKTGFEDRQAEAVVETISKAVSETVATKADLQLVRSDFKVLRSEFDLLRSEMATKADLQLVRSDIDLLGQSVDSRFEKTELKFDALENKIVIKLGALMVTMIFVLLAIGPFYFRWVMSLVGTP